MKQAVVVLGALVWGAAVGSSMSASSEVSAPAVAIPEVLEGVTLGQSFAEVDRRFNLGRLVPMELPPERRYVLEATRPLPDPVDKDFEARGIDRMELVFRGERLSSIRVGYAGRAEVLFEKMGQELQGQFGEPSSVVRRGPMQIGRSHGIRLYLWLSIWTWEGAESTLTVEGKHYGVDKVVELPRGHEYVFTLKAKEPTAAFP